MNRLHLISIVGALFFACVSAHADIEFESFGAEVKTVPEEVSWYPGKSYDTALAHESSTMVLETGTTLDKDARSYDSATFIMNGGIVSDEVWAMDSSTFHINGGEVYAESRAYNGTVNLNGGTTLKAWAEQSGEFTMTGGTVGWDAFAGDNAVFKMSGGELGVQLMDRNGAINVQQEGDVYLKAVDFGSGFSGGQIITLSDLGADPQGYSWANGTQFDLTFVDGSTTTLDFRARNGSSIPSSEWKGSLYLVGVPEPASWAGICGVCALFALLGRGKARK